MIRLTLIFLLFINIQYVFSQDTSLSYKCNTLGNHNVTLEVTPSDEPVVYLRSKVYINKYELKIADTPYSIFYTYKYKNRLYILNRNATKINCVKDQILFDKVFRKELKIDSIDGIMEHLELEFEKDILVNDKRFVTYSTDEYNFSELSVIKLVFDGDKDIAEMVIKAYDGTCSCSKQSVIIKSLEPKRLYNNRFNHKEIGVNLDSVSKRKIKKKKTKK